MDTRTVLFEHRPLEEGNEDLWKQIRNFYLTASDLYTFGELGDAWWPGSKEEILSEKILGTPRRFGGGDPDKEEEVLRKLAHGSFNEDTNLRKFSIFAKVRTRPTHFLISNERWPWLATTLDAIIQTPSRAVQIDPRVFTQPDHIQQIRDRLVFMTGTGVVEMKQAENKARHRNAWFGYTNRKGVWKPGYGPEYNQPQIQAQMHITGFKWGLLVGQIGAIHMQAHLFERDESFAEWMDDINEKFRLARLEYAREIHRREE